MNYVRQLELIDPRQIGEKSISIVGVGATGSYIAMMLAQMVWGNRPEGQGVLKVFDGDIIEEHNLANQIYEPSHVGMPKVVALNEMIKRKCNFEIITHEEMVTNQKTVQSTYVMLLTDTMSSRQEIFDECLRYSFGTDLVIETRMGLRDGRVYAFNPHDQDHVKEWKSTLYTDEEAQTSLCGASASIISTVQFLSSLAIGRIVHHFDVAYGSNNLNGTIESMWNEAHFSLYPESFYLRVFGKEPVITMGAISQ